MNKESFNFGKTFETLFHLTCIAATVGTTCWCFYIFLLDNDVCLVDFKKYGEEKEYIYPSFAMVFVNPFIEKKLKRYGENITTASYVSFLQGYHWDERMVNISYDNVTLDINDYFLGYDIQMADMEIKRYRNSDNGSRNGWKSPYVSYRHPTWKSFSVDIPYHKGERVIKIWTEIKTNIFVGGVRPDTANYNPSSSRFGGFSFLLHYPGQVFRSWARGIGKWSWPKRTNTSSKSYEMSFTRRNMDVVVRRNKKSKPCDLNWRNYDADMQGTLMRRSGCRPPYYDKIDLPVCSTGAKMWMVTHLTPHDFEEDGHPPPCRAISKLQFDYQDVEYDTNGGSNGNASFSLSVASLDPTFKLIELVRDYNIQTLIGNAGGYLGIFLGYALCQLPAALMRCFERFTKIEKNNAFKPHNGVRRTSHI
jgi:hypothetical protein